MRKWNKTCYSFKKVRNMLTENIETASQCIKIMYAMESCCDEIAPNSEADWEFYEDFRDLKSEIHSEIELMDELDYDSCENIVNMYLNDMYDLCDNAGIFLEL